MIEKTNTHNRLFDFYHPLLTEKQRDYFIMYYHKDYSLQEIADFHKVSKNAIYDQLSITSQKMHEYEEKLHLVKKAQQRGYLINLYRATKEEHYLNTLLEMDEFYV